MARFLLLLSGLFMWFPEYDAARCFARWMIFIHEGAALDHDRRLHHPRLHGSFHGPRQCGRDGARVRDEGLGKDASPAMVSREDRRIRAKLLARKYPESAHLLEFYIQITLLQDDIASQNLPLSSYFPRLRALPGPEALMRFPLTEDLEPSSPEATFFWRILNQPRAEAAGKTGDASGANLSFVRIEAGRRSPSRRRRRSEESPTLLVVRFGMALPARHLPELRRRG